MKSILNALLLPFRSYSYLAKTHNGSKVSNSNVVLILQSAQDQTNAFKKMGVPFVTKLHSNRKVKIIYKTVSCVQDIERAIEETKANKNNIQGLWFRTHGERSVLELGPSGKKDNLLNRDNLPLLKNSLNQIESDAVIVLEACDAGKINSSGHVSIAQSIATVAPGRLVIAPTKEIHSLANRFSWKNGKINLKFIVQKEKGRGVTGKLKHLFRSIVYVYSLGNIGTNCTAYFRQAPKKAKN